MGRKTTKMSNMILNPPSARSEVFISTGNDLLDIMLGAGLGYGVQSGQMVGLWAPPGAGKTALCNEIIANAKLIYGDKLKWVYDDPEWGNTFNSREMYGFDIIPEDADKVVRSTTVEEWSVNCLNFMENLKSDEFGIYALDSWDLLISQDSINRMHARQAKMAKGEIFDEGTFGMGKAKFLKSEAITPIKKASKEKNCIILIILQVVDKIGATGFQEKKTNSGGNSLEHNFDTKLSLLKREELKHKGATIGHVMKVTSKKLRGPLLKWECYVNMYGEFGIDNVGSNIDYLFDFRTKEGAVQTDGRGIWKGEPSTSEAVKQFMEDEGVMEDFLVNHKRGDKKEIYLAYIDAIPELKIKYDEKFGVPMSREELVSFVEANDLEEELTERVRAKQKQEWDNSTEWLRSRKRKIYLGGEE